MQDRRASADQLIPGFVGGHPPKAVHGPGEMEKLMERSLAWFSRWRDLLAEEVDNRSDRITEGYSWRD